MTKENIPLSEAIDLGLDDVPVDGRVYLRCSCGERIAIYRYFMNSDAHITQNLQRRPQALTDWLIEHAHHHGECTVLPDLQLIVD